jgi:hypothetical protein
MLFDWRKIANAFFEALSGWKCALACYRQLKFEMPSVRQSAAH